MARHLKTTLLALFALAIGYALYVMSFTYSVGEFHSDKLSSKVTILQSADAVRVESIWTSALFFGQEVIHDANDHYIVLETIDSKVRAIKLTEVFSNIILFSNVPLLILFPFGFAFPLLVNSRNNNRIKESIVSLNQEADKVLKTLSIDVPDIEQQNGISQLSLTLSEINHHLQEQRQQSQIDIFQDKLTGLIDRHAYLDRLMCELEQAQQKQQRCALLFIDLDGFKLVNDSFGHSFGDEILVQVAQRLRTVVRNHNLSKIDELTGLEMNLSRLGGDEFSVFVGALSNDEQATKVASNVLKEIERDFVLGNKIIKIGASIGIATYPDSAANPHSLLQMADVAMYRAKTDGRGIFRVYSPEMGSKMRRYHYLLEELKVAVAKRSLSLSFQPIVSVNDCTINYFEALSRWNHPVEGAIPPAEFIPIAEDSNLIIELGDWILFESCRQMAAWYNAGINRVKVSVNISGIQLKHVPIYIWVMKTLEKAGLPPNALVLEITESCFIDASDELMSDLHKLRKEGVSVAIDDFGTGFSSLYTLANLPVDVIKIDKLFIDKANENPKYHKILESITELGKQLKLKLVAEGVESASQFELVKKMGIDCVQGYLIGQPQPSRQVGSKVFNNNINNIAQMGTSVWGPKSKAAPEQHELA